MSGIEALAVVGMSLYLILGVFLVKEGADRKNGFVWLGIFFLLLGLNSLDAILAFGGVYHEYPSFFLWEDPMALLFGPLVYFFGKELRGIGLTRRDIIHLVPFFLAELFVLILHLRLSGEDLRFVLGLATSMELNAQVIAGFIPVFAHVLIYLWIARRDLDRHDQQCKQLYSEREIVWSRQFINLILAIFIISMAGSFLRLGTPTLFQTASFFVSILATIVLTFNLLLKALRYPVFRNKGIAVGKPDLDESELKALEQRLELEFSENKLYKRPDLVLEDVSLALDTSSRNVSFLINQRLAENFYDFVNRYRIEEAKRILIENKDAKLTVLEVMYEVGYNSKSSFNTQFKRKTGMTPTDFKKKHR